MGPVVEKLVSRPSSRVGLVELVGPRDAGLSPSERDTMSLIELSASSGGSTPEKGPEPGGDQVKAVALALEQKLRVQGEMSVAVGAELAVDDGRGEFTGSTVELSGIATVVP